VNDIIAELDTSANASILDFSFSDITQSGWACDISGNIFQWDMSTYKLLSQFKILDLVPDVEFIYKLSIITYANKTHALFGSHSIYLIDLESKSLVKTFPGHVQPINYIFPIPSNPDLFLTSAVGDRFINLYSIEKNSTKAVFVAANPVTNITLGEKDSKSVLVALSETGSMEIFNNPFADSPQPNSTPNGVSKKKIRQQMAAVQSRSCNSTINLSRPQGEIKSPVDANLFITSTSINDDHIIISWLENASISYFDSFRWLDENGQFIIEQDKTIYKSKPNLKTTQNMTDNGHDIAASRHYSEGHAIISDGTNVRDLENASDDEDDQETLAEKLDKISNNQVSNGTTKPKKKLGGNNAVTSLTLILSQSLRNNDHALLETVLSNRDPQVIQNTITKLDSSLAVVLLDRLSEKIQRQTSRFNQLNYWLKWIIIIHGAVLTSLPNLNTKLSNLHSFLVKKSSTLPRLLELQGRLTLLYQQTELKREILTEEMEDDTEEIDSDIEYIEELDDAKELGNEFSDIEIDGEVDDYEDSDEEIQDAEMAEENDHDDEEQEEEENYSDVEADTLK
jgi:U3 small nucleolar RNA-associated protein 5